MTKNFTGDNSYLIRIEKIRQEFNLLKDENFELAKSGTHYKVYISNNFVIRFRDDDQELLLREAGLLKQIVHPLISKVLWQGQVDNSAVIVENRLPGENINILWKTISNTEQSSIIQQIILFLQYLRTQEKDCVYSVNTDKKYDSFYDYLTDNLEQKVLEIKSYKQADAILAELLANIENTEVKGIFPVKGKVSLVHGDLIIHNLLADGGNLTGVLDWELSFFGDPDYDLSRILYYQECAKAYQEQGTDVTFEADYMDKLVQMILKSDLIDDKELFLKKHAFMRTIFYVNAFYWAANSDSPEKNISEIVGLWNKKAH